MGRVSRYHGVVVDLNDDLMVRIQQGVDTQRAMALSFNLVGIGRIRSLVGRMFNHEREKWPRQSQVENCIELGG